MGGFLVVVMHLELALIVGCGCCGSVVVGVVSNVDRCFSLERKMAGVYARTKTIGLGCSPETEFSSARSVSAYHAISPLSIDYRKKVLASYP